MTADEATFYAAVGIPQGLITDPETAETAGAVRRGGELLSLTPDEYALWSVLGTPVPRTALGEGTHPTVARLKGSRLVVQVDLEGSPGGQLGYLRPIPRGLGIGSLGVEPGVYQINDQPLSQAPALSVDPIAIMLWWEFDGATSIETAVDNVAKRIPELPRPVLERLTVVLLLHLMARRLIYLDTAYES